MFEYIVKTYYLTYYILVFLFEKLANRLLYEKILYMMKYTEKTLLKYI